MTDQYGRLLPESERLEICPTCRPEEFQEAFDPFGRIVTGPEAFPLMYTRDSEGVYHAKDELLADTAAKWDKGPSAKAAERKRKTRRTTPLTNEEINRMQDWGQRVLMPVYQEAMRGKR